jgi:hypothetical protein
MADTEPEPRAFAEAAVGNLTPIDLDKLTVKGGLRAVWNGVHQTHHCLEQHIAETRLEALTATEKRLAIASDLLDLKTDVRKLTLALGVEKPAEGEAKPKTATIAGWGPLKATLAGIGVVGTGIGGVAVLYKLGVALWPSLSHFLLTLK